MISARQIFLGRGGGAKLPYDAEVEYLESTGTQYIQTNYVPSIFQPFKAVAALMDFGDANLSTALGTAHSAGGGSYIPLMLYNGVPSIWLANEIGTAGGTSGQVRTITSRTVQASGYPDYWAFQMYCDGTYVKQSYQAKSNPIQWLGKVTIFACSYNNGSVARFSKSRFYSFSATDMETESTVIDLIPVRKDGVGYTYDRVSGTLLGNSGTGDIVVGPDKI